MGDFLSQFCIERAPEETLQAIRPFAWCQDALKVSREVAECGSDFVCHFIPFLVTEPVGQDLQIDFLPEPLGVLDILDEDANATLDAALTLLRGDGLDLHPQCIASIARLRTMQPWIVGDESQGRTRLSNFKILPMIGELRLASICLCRNDLDHFLF